MHTLRIFNHHIHSRIFLEGLLQALFVIGSVYLATLIRFWTSPSPMPLQSGILAIQACLFSGLVILSMFAMGLYQITLRDSHFLLLLRIGASFVLALLLLAGVFYVFPSLYLGRGVMGLAVAFALIATTGIHLLFSAVIDHARHRKGVLFYGAGHNAAVILSRLRRHADQRQVTLLGCIPADGEEPQVDPSQICMANGSLMEYARRNHVNEIVVAMDDRRRAFPMYDLLACRLANIEVTDINTFCERQLGKIKVDLLKPNWIVFSGGLHKGLLCNFLKRGLDLFGSLFLLVLFSPLMLLAAAAIVIEDGPGSPVLFRQLRVGQNGRKFRIFKFRSMRPDAESGRAVWAAVGDSRVTRVGAWLRKFHVDELPQLLNVLRNEMSLVGPRPERPEFVTQLMRGLPYYPLRHMAKPGLTGWAQLRYPYGDSERDALEKLQFDLYYVKHSGLFLDLVILLGTVEVVLFGKGAR